VLLAAQAASSTPPPRPLLMGVLNVTPDSFSDGGLHFEHDQAVARGLDLLAQGAHWLDIGGESTRPGADPVTIEEELRRVVPVIQTLRQEGCKRLSIDTRHARVAAAAIEAGATMVNDVGAGLDDDGMLDVVRDSGCDWVLMHRQGSPGEMQRAPRYGDAVADICDFLRCRVAHCLEAGVQESALWVDPGIGFGKALEHNLEILRRLPELRSLGIPLLLGPSRKSFIGHVTGAQQEADWQRVEARDDPKLRLGGTAAAITFCVLGGAQILRVHDVAVMAEASAVAAAIAAHPNP
jgi:dihydropteroate synthase